MYDGLSINEWKFQFLFVQGRTEQLNSQKEIKILFSNQHYGIIIELRKYVYLCKLFSGEQVAHGSLFYFTCIMQPFLQFTRQKKPSSLDVDFLNPEKD